MTQYPEHPEHPGMRRFAQVAGQVLSQPHDCGSQGTKSKRARGGQRRGTPPPRALAEIMEEEARARIQDKLEIRRDLFLLDAGQTRYLAGITDPRAASLLAELNGLGIPRSHIAPHRRQTEAMLKILCTVPQSPAGWTAWWLENAGGYLGLFQGDVEENDEYPVLLSALRSAAEAALENIPLYTDLAGQESSC